MPTITTVYIGAEQRAKKNWSAILGDPKKPSNWKDETYLAKKAELQAKQAEEAPSHIAAGEPAEMCMIVDSGPGVKPSEIVGSATNVLSALSALGIATGTSLLRIVGFDPLPKLRQAAWSSVTANKHVSSWVWNTEPDPKIINLYSCSGAKHDSDMSLEQFINYWAAIEPVKPIEGLSETKSQAALEARLVYHIAKLMGF